MAAQQQRMYAMQMQNQGRNVNSPVMRGRPVGTMANPQQMAALRQMQQQQQYQQNSAAKPSNPEAFLRSLQKFMMSRNLPLDANPIISGRPISIVQLYFTVMKLGGSKKVSAVNMWPAVSQQVQLPPVQFPMAMHEIREYYQRNLFPYEQFFVSSQQKQLAEQAQAQQQQQQQQAVPRQPTTGDTAMPLQSSMVKSTPHFEPPVYSPQEKVPVSGSVSNNAANGLSTPTPMKGQDKQQQHQQRMSVSRQSQPPEQQQPQQQQPGKRASSSSIPGSQAADRSNQPLNHPIEDPFKPVVLPESSFHGPVVVDEMYQLGEDISRLKPNVPSFGELGLIDIRALTMSLKSGIHAEVRMALDTVTTISCEPVTLSLEICEDLVESLVECAEDQMELLAENAAEVSDVMLLSSYEEITRGCQAELTSLADVPEVGSLDYELDRAVDRLICVTTILRNFSFSEANFAILGIPPVVSFMSTIIRYLGTRNMLLRTQQNTLDLAKDVIIYLSNLAHTVQLPTKEDALCLLHFLLSFAPSPVPTVSAEGGVIFTPYNPSTHKYTPAAVDSLAKLLARDEPNRTFFKMIFTEQQDLLTRAFGLAICPVPDQPRKQIVLTDARKVFLLQGLLAADILTGIADEKLAKMWLDDGFATHLLRLSCALSSERVPQANYRQAQMRQWDVDAYAYSSIVNRALSILCRLGEKARRRSSATGDDDPTPQPLPSGMVLKKENLVGVMLLPAVDSNIVRQLVSYSQLAE